MEKPEPTANVKPDIAFNWSVPEEGPEPIPEGEQDIPISDQTPTILEQARLSGWVADYFHFGKLEGQGTEYFNPAIVRRPDGLWLITRASGLHPQGFMYGQNALIAFKLGDDGHQPHYGKVLHWPVDNPVQHFEDPRVFYHAALGQTMIGACTFLWHGRGDWTGALQVFGGFDENWDCKKMDYPKIGGNPGALEKIKPKDYEKNWVWWLHEGKLCLLYKSSPWTVIEFGDRWSHRTEHKEGRATWPNGEIRGGTSPIKVGDYYWTFHHSSLPWKGRYRRYYAGAIAFESKAPFTPRLITSEPLLQGSQNDPWAQRKPLVIFPCGALYKDEKWLITCGVNDLKAAWIEIPHQSLMERMQPMGNDDSLIFYGMGPILSGGVGNSGSPAGDTHGATTSRAGTNESADHRSSAQVASGGSSAPPAQTTLEKRRAALVKARAARAAKRKQINGQCEHEWDVSTGGAHPSGTVICNLCGTHKEDVQPRKRRRRRKRRTSAQMAEARAKALQEHEAEKSLVPEVET